MVLQSPYISQNTDSLFLSCHSSQCWFSPLKPQINWSYLPPSHWSRSSSKVLLLHMGGYERRSLFCYRASPLESSPCSIIYLAPNLLDFSPILHCLCCRFILGFCYWGQLFICILIHALLVYFLQNNLRFYVRVKIFQINKYQQLVLASPHLIQQQDYTYLNASYLMGIISLSTLLRNSSVSLWMPGHCCPFLTCS